MDSALRVKSRPFTMNDGETVNIRHAVEGDTKAYAEIRRLVDERFKCNIAKPGERTADPMALIKRCYSDLAKQAVVWVVEDWDGRLVGYIQTIKPPAYFARIAGAVSFSIGLHPDYVGRGLGTEMLKLFKEWALATDHHLIHLWVFGNNPKAIELYRREGYGFTGVLPKRVRFDELTDQIEMGLRLYDEHIVLRFMEDFKAGFLYWHWRLTMWARRRLE